MSYVSVSGKNWIFKEFNSADIKEFCEIYSLSHIVSKLLSIRKKNIENIDLFLNPTIKNLLPNPLRLKDMDIAISRIFKSISSKEIIGIFGDYDVDGATSTAILSLYFESIKQSTKIYIPDRRKEGYGPTIQSFNKLSDLGAKIILTVDCGTLSFDPINFIKKKNIDVIVLDHHQSDIKLPKALAIINPNRHDDSSNLNYLCAAGVCFMFIVGLNKKLRDTNWFKDNKIKEPNILNLLDLVSLGTVCDVVPLIGLNRAIVSQGLKIMKKRYNLGLKTLYDLCKIESQPNIYHLGYILGPRINAGGRVGKSSHGVELLTSNDPKKAYQIASDLDKSNLERKSIELLLIEKVDLEAKKYLEDPVLVLNGNNWHEGIIGIVASRIKEKYHKPTILISITNSTGKGSARSIFGYDIGSQVIKATQLGIVERGGGHKMAAGFTIKKDSIPVFRDFLIKSFNKKITDKSKVINLYLDTIIAPSAINEEFFLEVEKLGPFGSGNNEPKFVIEDIKVISSQIVGDNHIKSILIGKDGKVFNGFSWNGKNTPLEQFLDKANKKKINIAGRMRLNEWKGKKKVEFMIEDISVN